MSNRGNRGRGGGGPGRGDGGFRGRGGGDFQRGGARGGFGGRGRGGPPQIFAADVPPRIDARLGTAEGVVEAFKKVPYDPANPLRPGYGKLGQPVTLRANFFPVEFLQTPIYEYKVTIEPKTDIQRIKGQIFQLLERQPQFAPHLPYIAHDRSERLVAAKKLPQPLAVSFPFVEDGMSGPAPNAKTYTLNITYTHELDPSEVTKYLSGNVDYRNYDPLPVVSALNLVLQTHATRVAVRVGKNRYFYKPGERERLGLGQGVEAWKGFFLSVRPVSKQLMVNVNVCMTAFYEPGNLVDAIQAFQRNSFGALPQRFVKSLKVRTKHLGHTKAVKRIDSRPASKIMFDCEELGGKVSVAQYFKKKYPNLPLKYADTMPVVDIGPRNRSVFVPAELCDIMSGTPYVGKLDGRETAQMIKYACNDPATNANSIVREGLPKLGLSPAQAASPLAAFGISVSNEMATIPARVLPPPSLSYRVGVPSIKDGGWNILDVKFQKGASLAPGWAVLLVRDGGRDFFQGPQDPALIGFLKTFQAKLQKAGMDVGASGPKILSTEMLPNPNQDPNRQQALQMIKDRLTKNLDPNKKPSFVLVLLSLEDNYIYPGIKRLGDVVLGLHTVCMLLPKAKRDDPKKLDQYFSNVALKVNTKLGGMNHLLDAGSMKWLTEKRTMLVGCDVTHPGPTSTPGTPSIAAVVASTDSHFVQFPASLRAQESKKEMITEFDMMLEERLLLYKTKSKNLLPERVYIFRDGVSEGQFHVVLEEELPLVRKAFKRVYGTAQPPLLTIIICGKRHHARPIPTSVETATHNGNNKPGTVVDKGITDVYRHDFYLQAHSGLQGQARSTHYTLIYDENKLSADTIQQGTNTSSYSYARATKAVSLIPPAYYADLACERGRFYINEFLNLGDERTSTLGSGGEKLSKDQEKQRAFDQAKLMWGQGVHQALRDSMFYI